MKEELTTKMHSEFSVSEETEIKLRAGNIWNNFKDAPKSEQLRLCKVFGITWEQAMKYKTFWLSLSK